MNFILKTQLNLDSEIIKESSHLEAKAKELEKKKPEIEKEMKKLEDGALWEAAEAFRKAKAVESSDLPVRHAEYMRLLNQKNLILSRYQRDRDHIRVKCDALMFQPKAEVSDLFDRTIEKVLAMKQVKWPLARGHEYLNKIVDYERIDLKTGVVWLKIFSNGPAVAEAHRILMLSKGRLAEIMTATDLLTLLDNTDQELNKIDLDLKEYEIKKDDFEFSDPRRFFEFQTFLRPGDALKDVAKISKDGKPLNSFGALMEDSVGFHRPK